MCLSGQIGKCRKDRVNRNLHLARASALQLVTVQTGNDVREGLKKIMENSRMWMGGVSNGPISIFLLLKKKHISLNHLVLS